MGIPDRAVLVALTALAFVALTGCTSVAKAPPSVRLSGAQLMQTLDGHYVAVVGQDLLTEYFCRGAWQLMGARVPLSGQYSVAGDRVCVQPQGGASSCRHFLRDADGGYFTQGVEEEHAETRRSRVRIFAGPSTAACS